jgi:hypothetical protein
LGVSNRPELLYPRLKASGAGRAVLSVQRRGDSSSTWGYYSGLATAIFPREICRISSWGVRVYAR